MYSVQHVLWRGAMALSLLLVAGVGAGVSSSEQERAAEECQDTKPAIAVQGAAVQGADVLPHYQLDVVVVTGSVQPDEA